MSLQAIHAENIHAELLIVIQPEENSKDMIGNQTSVDYAAQYVTIPSVMISSEMGIKLKKLLKESVDPFVKFEMNLFKSDQVAIDFYIQENDMKVFDFLNEFKQVAYQFGELLNVYFHFYNNGSEGKDRVKMQSILSCMHLNEAMRVLEVFKRNCIDRHLFNSVCLYEQIGTIEVEGYQRITVCISNQIPYLSTWQDQMRMENNSTKSLLLINKMIFFGNWNSENVFEAICEGFILSPNQCLLVNNKYTLNEDYKKTIDKMTEGRTWVIVVGFILLLALLVGSAIILAVVYGKIYQQILAERVGKVVRESIEVYSLKDTSGLENSVDMTIERSVN